MNKTVAFISLFRNVNSETKKVTWKASFRVDDKNVGSAFIPKMDKTLFKTLFRKAVFGNEEEKTAYFTSKMPLLIEYSGIQQGRKPGKYFTNIVTISENRMSIDELDDMLSSDDNDVNETEDKNEEVAEEIFDI